MPTSLYNTQTNNEEQSDSHTHTTSMQNQNQEDDPSLFFDGGMSSNPASTSAAAAAAAANDLDLSLFSQDIIDAASLLDVPSPRGGKGNSSGNGGRNLIQSNMGMGMGMNYGHSPTASSSSDISLSPLAYQHAYNYNLNVQGGGGGSSSSRLPSLSPSTQSMNLTNSLSGGLSPRSASSASPSSNSNFSYGAAGATGAGADDFLLNSFSASELDMLFLTDPNGSSEFNVPYDQAKPGQSLFLPGLGLGLGQGQQPPQLLQQPRSQPSLDQVDNGNGGDDMDGNNNSNFDFIQNLLNGSMSNGFGNDDTFDMLNLAESPLSNGNSNGNSNHLISDEANPSSVLNFDFAQQARAIGNVGGRPFQFQQQQQNALQNGQMAHAQHVNMHTNIGQSGWSAGPDVKPITREQAMPFGQSNVQNMGTLAGQQYSVQPDSDTASQIKSKPRVTQPKRQVVESESQAKLDIAAAGLPTVGKHNKTERRYRQKVQAAQADLRDAIPALRLLYDTSTPEQKLMTDFRASDGTVDGLGEVTRPNASAKATILIGARMYIELLQKRSAMLQRKVNELEAFRSAVAGQEEFQQWQANFDAREREIQAAADAAAALKMDEDSLDEDDEGEDEEENEPKRKKPKTVAVPKEKAPRAKPGPKSKKAQAANIAQAAAGGGLRVFAAFAMSFSFIPSASTVLKQTSTETSTAGQVLSSGSVGNATTGQILSRLPLITAEHTSMLLARSLPAAVVPAPHTLVDWVWRLLVAVVLAVSMGPIISRWTRAREEDEKRKAGRLSAIAKDCARFVMPRSRSDQAQASDELYWTRLAAGIVGGVFKPSTLEKWHVILHLNNTASDAYSLALLALLQPELPLLRSSKLIWHEAQSRLSSSSPAHLATVLKLPLPEVHRCAESLEKTSSPIAAVAEQITLVHIYDLYARFFIRLVDASTRSKSATSTAPSTKSLLSNLESCDIGHNLKSSAFDKEVRTVIDGLPRGSAAHALGLVLVGLWGIFTRPAPSAQAALASALAAEEVQGAGAGLSSVSSMLELLYPGSRDVLATKGVDRASRAARLPSNALAIDKLATACIDYIRLLTSSVEVNEAGLTRLQRLEASRKVQKDTAHLRLVLTHTKFVGMAGDVLHQRDTVHGQGHEVEYQSDSDSISESDSDAGQERSGRDHDSIGLENEGRKFEMAKERLVKVLCNVGRRAAGRASGRDEDSGFEGDLEEL